MMKMQTALCYAALLAALAARGDIVRHDFPISLLTYTNENGIIVETPFPVPYGLPWDSPWFERDPDAFPHSLNREARGSFDLNLDGTADFHFRTGWGGGGFFSIYPTNGTAVWAYPNRFPDPGSKAAPLFEGDIVGPEPPGGGSWVENERFGAGLCAAFDVGASGLLCGMENAYMGLRFEIDGNTHYGWMNLWVERLENNGTLRKFAYEDEPDTPIPIIPEPSTLGLFGLAALALLLRRRCLPCPPAPSQPLRLRRPATPLRLRCSHAPVFKAAVERRLPQA